MRDVSVKPELVQPLENLVLGGTRFTMDAHRCRARDARDGGMGHGALRIMIDLSTQRCVGEEARQRIHL